MTRHFVAATTVAAAIALLAPHLAGSTSSRPMDLERRLAQLERRCESFMRYSARRRFPD